MMRYFTMIFVTIPALFGCQTFTPNYVYMQTLYECPSTKVCDKDDAKPIVTVNSGDKCADILIELKKMNKEKNYICKNQ